MKNLLKRGLAFLLTTVMATGIVSYVPSGTTDVVAADGDATTKTVAGVGTNVITDPTAPAETTDAWKGSYVYFGTYGTDDNGNPRPVKYRVLDSNTTVYGGTTMLLDCDSILWTDEFDNSSNDWEYSDIRTYLNGTFLANNFSKQEQSAIASSTKSEAYSGTDGADGNGYTYLSFCLFLEKITVKLRDETRTKKEVDYLWQKQYNNS